MDPAVTGVRVADVTRAVLDAFPAERAEAWDRVGLLAGDPEASVTGVLLALDPTVEAVRAAARSGANVVVTHHPAFLQPPNRVVPAPAGAGGAVYEAVSRGVALINAHTNLDRDERAQRLIPEALGLVPVRPVETSLQPLALVTVYAPPSHGSRLAAAMEAAGAGRIGDYAGCSFTGTGVGSFTPGAGTNPCIGLPGEPSSADEIRLEMVCPRNRAGQVVAAAVAAHPYEEPLVTAVDVEVARNGSALGMLSVPAQGESLKVATLAALASRVFGVAPRVWGPADTPVNSIATATGSAGSLIEAALEAGADALVAGEVRYHDALDASARGLSVIELGHDVSEWPLVGLLEEVVKAIAGIDPATVTVLPPHAGWWTPNTVEGA